MRKHKCVIHTLQGQYVPYARTSTHIILLSIIVRFSTHLSGEDYCRTESARRARERNNRSAYFHHYSRYSSLPSLLFIPSLSLSLCAFLYILLSSYSLALFLPSFLPSCSFWLSSNLFRCHKRLILSPERYSLYEPRGDEHNRRW